jgi:hypothetical protein
MGRGGVLAAVSGLLIPLLVATTASAQPADYLKNAVPWQQSTKGISGVWNMQGYLSSSIYPVRQRVAKTMDGQLPPLLPAAAALLEKRISDAEHDKPFPNTASLCLPQGVPYMIHAAVDGPLQIFETPGQVTIISTAYNEMWLIYLNGKHPGPDDLEPTYHGDSIGHWEGDTLVVDTVGLTTKTTLDQVGMPHSDALHVITRIRRTDPKTLEFLVTVDDPKTFSKPWTRRQIYKKAKDDARVEESVCENNRNGVDSSGYQSLDIKH